MRWEKTIYIYIHLIFELDIKLVVHTFHSSSTDRSEIRSIIYFSEDICRSFAHVNVYL